MAPARFRNRDTRTEDYYRRNNRLYLSKQRFLSVAILAQCWSLCHYSWEMGRTTSALYVRRFSPKATITQGVWKKMVRKKNNKRGGWIETYVNGSPVQVLFQVSIYIIRSQRVEFGIISICRLLQQGAGEDDLPLGKDPVGLLLGTIFAFWLAFAFRWACRRHDSAAKCVDDVYVIGVLFIKTRFAIYSAKEEVDCIRFTIVVSVAWREGEKANFSICFFLTIETRGPAWRKGGFSKRGGEKSASRRLTGHIWRRRHNHFSCQEDLDISEPVSESGHSVHWSLSKFPTDIARPSGRCGDGDCRTNSQGVPWFWHCWKSRRYDYYRGGRVWGPLVLFHQTEGCRKTFQGKVATRY